jgi:hypothetical protein
VIQWTAGSTSFSLDFRIKTGFQLIAQPLTRQIRLSTPSIAKDGFQQLLAQLLSPSDFTSFCFLTLVISSTR